jgi:hypothetical protein
MILEKQKGGYQLNSECRGRCGELSASQGDQTVFMMRYETHGVEEMKSRPESIARNAKMPRIKITR